MKTTTTYLALAALAAQALGRDIPSNVQSFANRIRNGKCTGGKVLQDGFYDIDGGSKCESTANVNK